MRDMEYLTEKDLPFFRELAKKGEAVIIYIDPDALLAADDEIAKLLDECRNKETGLTEEKLTAFLNKNSLVLSEEARRSREVLEENKKLQAFLDTKYKEAEKAKKKVPVEKLIRKSPESETELPLIRRAIADGFTDDEIRILMSGKLDEKQRELVYQGIRARKL